MTRRPEREERARADTDADDAWEAPAWSLHGDGGEYGEGAAPAGPPPGELGRGGAGVVTRGPDRHLPREVAWKRAARDDARLHARLAAEARALAGLEHPNIVPIYDRATGADGELRVALRIIRGDTLEALIRRTPALERRLDLVRDVLKAVEAVAWAHHEGWIHRDLKPANLMIGAFGEVQVIDWGLALRADEAPDPALEPPGAPIGTPTAMSPEQARGELATRASDVWGLGVTLFELVVGRPLKRGDPGAALTALRVGRRDRVLDRCPEAPPALAAIIERALAFHPEARYPDARALALDLSAFLDSRRVSAHAYGAAERLARFVRRWRVPLGLGLATLVGALVVGAIAYGRLASEQERVSRAHASALSALAARDAEIVRSWAGEARRALEADQRPEAEVAAARALAVGEDPEARGVLAAFARAPRPQRVADLPGVDCLDADVSPSGERVLCGRRDAVSVFEGGRERWSAPCACAGAAFAAGAEVVVVQSLTGALELRDARDGRVLRRLADPIHLGLVKPGPGARYVSIEDREQVALVDLAGARLWRPCGAGMIQATAFTAHEHAALCGDGTLVTRPAASGAEVRLATPLASPVREFVALDLIDAERALVGTTRGALHLVDRRTGATVASRTPAARRMMHRIAVEPGAARAVLELEGQGLALVTLPGLDPLGLLPHGTRLVRWLDAPHRLASRGPGVALWDWPLGPPYRLGDVGAVSGLEDGPDGLAVARDEGATLFDRATGAALWRHGWGRGVTKRVVARGEAVVVATAGMPPRELLEAAGDFHVVTQFPARRLFLLPGGGFVRSLTSPGMGLWWGVGDSLELSPRHHNDLAVYGAWALGLESRPSRFTLYDLGAAPVGVARCDDAAAVAVALGPGGPEGVTPFTLQADAVVAWDLASCTPLAQYDSPRGELRALAVSPDGAWVAAGTRVGELVVWRRDGALVSVAPLHAEAVTALVSDARGEGFITGAWDGQVRYTDLATLAADRRDLARTVLGRW